MSKNFLNSKKQWNLKATLKWFAETRGVGLITVGEDSYTLHFSSIVGIDKNNYAWPTEEDQERLSKLGYNNACVVTISQYGVERCRIIKDI